MNYGMYLWNWNLYTPAIMFLYPHSAVYHSHPRMRTSCLLNWSYNMGSERGNCTINITWPCGCVERRDTQTGIHLYFILKRRLCNQWVKQEEAGFALASWPEKTPLSAGTLPPTVSPLLEDGAPYPVPLRCHLAFSPLPTRLSAEADGPLGLPPVGAHRDTPGPNGPPL